jgi:hypothetical protein
LFFPAFHGAWNGHGDDLTAEVAAGLAATGLMEDTGAGTTLGRAVMGVGASGVARAGEMGEATIGVAATGRGGIDTLGAARAGETNGGLIVAEALEEAFTVGLFCAAWQSISWTAND